MPIATTPGLKPPPRAVTNEWAWSYTLTKLREKGLVDQSGNPTNYGAAMAIYKRVAAKYGDPSDVPDAAPGAPNAVLSRAQMLAIDDGAVWVVGHGMAFSATESAHQRLWLQTNYQLARGNDALQIVEPQIFWRVERVMDGQTQTSTVTVEGALWLTRESVQALGLVYERTIAAIAQLDIAIDEAEAHEPVIAGVRRARDDASFDFEATREALMVARATLEGGLDGNSQLARDTNGGNEHG